MSRKLIVAIDGPSGAGKSTLSKALSKRTGYLHIDTGAMYRSVALLAKRRHIDVNDDQGLKELCEQLSIEFIREAKQELVIVNGEDVTQAIRTPDVSLLTAQVAACPSVRKAMVGLQREMGAAGGVVLEGRDIGTVVFPHAEVKFFLSATAVERGRRRHKELSSKGLQVDLQQTIAEVEQRDAADSTREHAPLQQAADAVVIDSTNMSIAKVLEEMQRIITERQ